MKTELIGTICTVCKKGIIQDKSSDFPYYINHKGQCDYCFSEYIGKWNKKDNNYERETKISQIARE